MQGALALVVLSVLLLPGCAGPQAAGLAQTTQPAEPPTGPKVSATEGAIQGTLVDDQLAPIVAATVLLETSDLKPSVLATTASDEAGLFEFSLLDPGAYRIRANQSRYSETVTIVQVVANEVAGVRLVLTVRPVDEPYIELRIFSGITGCDSWGLIITFIVLGGTCPTQAGASPGYNTSIPTSWRYLAFELTWAANDEFIGFAVSPNIFTCDTQPCYGVTVGPSPRRLDGVPGKKMQNHTDFYNAPSGGIEPYPEGAFKTDVFAYHGGLFGRQATQAMEPTDYCPQWCYGVGTTLERRFTIYQSTFHFQAPPDPKSYSAIPPS